MEKRSVFFAAVVVALTVGGAMGQTAWTLVKKADTGSLRIDKLLYVNNQLFGIGGSRLFTSSDGISWTKRADWNDDRYSSWMPSITWTGTLYVGVGGNKIYTSPDGIMWSRNILGGSQTLYGVTFANNQLVAVGDESIYAIGSGSSPVYSGIVFTSTDGVVWTKRYTIPIATNTAYTTSLTAIAWNGSKYIAVGKSGTIITSTDGKSWNLQYSGTVDDLNQVLWAGTQFVAAGAQNLGSIIASPDGNSWSFVTRPYPVPFHSDIHDRDGSIKSLLWTGTTIVAAGNTGYYDSLYRQSLESGIISTTRNGTSWKTFVFDKAPKHEYPEFWGLSSMAFTGNKFVASAILSDTLSNGDQDVFTAIYTAPIDPNAIFPLQKSTSSSGFSVTGNSGSTKIFRYSLAEKGLVSLHLFDLRGREVFSGINKVQNPGDYTFTLSTKGFSHGTYLQVLKIGDHVEKSVMSLTW